MEEIKLSDDVIDDDVIEQIKDFGHRKLNEEQKSLIDKLILNEELKKRYKLNGLCKECNQPNTSDSWCQPCNAKHFQINFENWTSENHDVNEFIQKIQFNAKSRNKVLEWIECDRFENIKYLATGRFGTIYKATWKDGYISKWDSENNQWERWYENMNVALKCIHNSQAITVEFLREVESHNVCNSGAVVHCYGISKDPKTNDFIMVMEYVRYGSLRQHLNNKFNSLNWEMKSINLTNIANGLMDVHENGLIHHDFHCGNVLSFSNTFTRITDLRLCQKANIISSQSDDKKIYGVLPYVAPEVLRGGEYTQASDIYGFGIIAYEVCTGLPPYHDIEHGNELAIGICQGLRPASNYKIPQIILNIIKQCWDADPLKRPKARELYESLCKLLIDLPKENSLIHKQAKKADEINNQSTSTMPSSSSVNRLSYTIHPQAIYTSRLLDFKNLPEPKNTDNIDDSFEPEFEPELEPEYSGN